MNKLWNENKITFIIITAGVFIAGIFYFLNPTSPFTKNQFAPVNIVQPISNEVNKDCIIKGNISFNTKEKIYHMPNCPYYSSTKIDERYGERWFCAEQEAISAGWRKAFNCP